MQDEEMGTRENGGGVEEANKGSGSSASEDKYRGSDGMVLGVVISQPKEIPKSPHLRVDKAVAAKKGFLERSDSYHEVCRVCQQQTDEALLDLGCRCRGELAKAHGSCIGIWFSTKGSNRCEICQQVAANVPFPEAQPCRNYWVWRVDPTSRSSTFGRRECECCNPLCLAFTILIGGLLLDVLISLSLGMSALPVNIIIDSQQAGGAAFCHYCAYCCAATGSSSSPCQGDVQVVGPFGGLSMMPRNHWK